MSFLVPMDATTWVEGAQGSAFPIQNLPFGMLKTPVGSTTVIRIGNHVVALGVLADAGLLDGPVQSIEAIVRHGGRPALTALRRAVYGQLSEPASVLATNGALRERALVPLQGTDMDLPVVPGAFADFYSGICHASNVGRMFRPDQPPLLPNYRHLPVAYNGRASSVVVSGVQVVRPCGQTRAARDPAPAFGPSRELDFELEMGYYLASGCEMGGHIAADDAEGAVAGLVLVNDWSARDVQRWEYQPLGPFLSKSFASIVCPWLVTVVALEPFRIDGMVQEPAVLPHLQTTGRRHMDIVLDVSLQSERMTRPQRICTSNTKHLYWSIAQQIAHLTSNGTNVQPCDLYASGTISGEEPGSFGSMLELTWRGERPLLLEETGEERCFLEDGDTVTMTAYAEAQGVRVGFGEVVTRILPARG